MRKNIVISLLLFTFVICSPYCLYLCSSEANGDENPPMFELKLEPENPSTWPGWRPKYKENASFVATIKGKTSTGVAITKFTNVRFTFDLGTPSRWEGVCMNFNGDTDVKKSYDLFFRKEDNDIADGWEDDHIHDYNPWDDKENGPGINLTSTHFHEMWYT